MKHTLRILLVACLYAALPGVQLCNAQTLLSKTISIDLKKKPLGDVLNAIGRQGGFYFSYNSTIINRDSLVTLSVKNKTVKQALDMLLGERMEYKETDNYIIIKPAEKEKWYAISGYITDVVTGQPVADASVYERQQLISTLSGHDGHFKLFLKDREKYPATNITISKGFYTDTNLILLKGYDQEITIQLSLTEHTLPDIVITQYSNVERSWLGKFLFSSGLRKQSANLGKFFVDKPFQVSLTPGLGTHGKMSGQVTNKFSFNALGGYSAGVDGFELGGLFNIDKKDVRYVQVAGIFNIVSGGVKGVQVGGIANTVSKSVCGVQISGIVSQVADSVEGVIIAGICSRAGGSIRGLQLSGIANLIVNRDSATAKKDTVPEALRGVQIAGIVNIVNGHSHGLQLAGIANLNQGDLHGVQMCGILNAARKVEGSQIGLINIADTVTGYCFGIINIVKHGYHIISLSSDEITTYNVAYKAGSKKLYSIILGGINTTSKSYGFVAGYGIGKEIAIGKRAGISMELTARNIYPSSKDSNMIVVRFEPSISVRLHKTLTLFTGPSVSFCPGTQPSEDTGFLHTIPQNAVYTINNNGNAAWVGWQVGLHIF